MKHVIIEKSHVLASETKKIGDRWVHLDMSHSGGKDYGSVSVSEGGKYIKTIDVTSEAEGRKLFAREIEVAQKMQEARKTEWKRTRRGKVETVHRRTPHGTIDYQGGKIVSWSPNVYSHERRFAKADPFVRYVVKEHPKGEVKSYTRTSKYGRPVTVKAHKRTGVPPTIKESIKNVEEAGWKFQYRNGPWYVFRGQPTESEPKGKEVVFTLNEIRDAFKHGF